MAKFIGAWIGLFVFFIGVFGGFIMLGANIFSLIELSEYIVVLLATLGVLAMSYGWKEVGVGIIWLFATFIPFSNKFLTERTSDLMKSAIGVVYKMGFLHTLLGVMITLSHLGGGHLPEIGYHIKGALAGIFFSILLAECLIRPALCRIETYLNCTK